VAVSGLIQPVQGLVKAKAPSKRVMPMSHRRRRGVAQRLRPETSAKSRSRPAASSELRVHLTPSVQKSTAGVGAAKAHSTASLAVRPAMARTTM
jgi:hypothetical protein